MVYWLVSDYTHPLKLLSVHKKTLTMRLSVFSIFEKWQKENIVKQWIWIIIDWTTEWIPDQIGKWPRRETTRFMPVFYMFMEKSQKIWRLSGVSWICSFLQISWYCAVHKNPYYGKTRITVCHVTCDVYVTVLEFASRRLCSMARNEGRRRGEALVFCWISSIWGQLATTLSSLLCLDRIATKL